MEPVALSKREERLIALVVVLGVLTIVRDLLQAAERLRLAAELDADPEGPGRAAEDILREEEENGSEQPGPSPE